jgi:hypothetical protein
VLSTHQANELDRQAAKGVPLHAEVVTQRVGNLHCRLALLLPQQAVLQYAVHGLLFGGQLPHKWLCCCCSGWQRHGLHCLHRLRRRRLWAGLLEVWLGMGVGLVKRSCRRCCRLHIHGCHIRQIEQQARLALAVT